MTDRSSKKAKDQRAGRARLGLSLSLLSRAAALVAIAALVVACASAGARKAPPPSSGHYAYSGSRAHVSHAPGAPRAASAEPASSGSSADSSKSSYAPPPPSSPSSSVRTVTPSGAVVTRRPYRAEPPRVPQPRVSLLTAASVGDVDRYSNYMSYLSRHPSEMSRLGLQMNRRVRFRVVDAKGKPVNDAAIIISASGSTINGRTHADGWWDFFPGVVAPHAQGNALATIKVGQQIVRAQFSVPSHGDGQRVTVKLPHTAALSPRSLDLAFLIDVTGSMGDELRYVNREIKDIVRRVKSSVPNTNVRLGAVFYRDRGDAVPLRLLPFTSSVQRFRSVMSSVRASGGGDYPEDLNAGIAQAMQRLDWSKGNAVRVLVVLADAPPKHYADAQYRYQHAMIDASARGIRLLPVAASGSNRVVEYLFRAMGAMTSTPYAYLTDDSGIGGRHQEADTDRVGVERFNQLLTRLIVSDLTGKGMHEPGALGPQ